nr:EOG090X0AVC [Eurycercus lamellatus]
MTHFSSPYNESAHISGCDLRIPQIGYESSNNTFPDRQNWWTNVILDADTKLSSSCHFSLKMMSYDDNEIEDIFGDTDKYNESEDDVESDLKKSRENQSDEADEEKNGDEVSKNGKKKATPSTRKVTKGPQLKLDANRLCGPRGVMAIEESFCDVKLKGKGYEASDLDLVLKKMEHWAHRLFPKLPFDDCIERVEKLGNNRSVQVFMKKIRMDVLESSELNNDVNDENLVTNYENEHQEQERNAFDDLVAQNSTPISKSIAVTEEQQERMAENKRKAEEKRKSRLLASQSSNPNTSIVPDPTPNQHVPVVSNSGSCSKENLIPDDDELMDIDAIIESISEK